MLETNRIYNIDVMDGLKLLDDNSIDLIITSPPYNKAGLNGIQKGKKWKGTIDYNAALNILEEGIHIYKENIGLSSPEFTHVDFPTVDDRCSYNLKSSGRLNREKNVFQ